MKKIIRVLNVLLLLAIMIAESGIIIDAAKCEEEREFIEERLDDAYTRTYLPDDDQYLPYDSKMRLPKIQRVIYSDRFQNISWRGDYLYDTYRELYDWYFETDNIGKRIEKLLINNDIPAVIVTVSHGVSRSSLQYISEDKESGMTFTKVTIKQVLRNPEEDATLVEGNTIYLKESYFHTASEKGEQILYCDYGCYQKPLRPKEEYLVFLYDLHEYDIVSPPEEKIYAFNERFFWNLSDSNLDDQYRYGLIYKGLYADYHQIQNEYLYKVAFHFGLLNGQTQSPNASNNSQPNVIMIIVSTSVLLALGALTYTVNETVKKSRQSKDT